MAIVVPTDDLDGWLKELKPYQRNALRELVKTRTPEEAAIYWVTAQGSANIVPFGGSHDSKPFWDRFKAEFRKFLCDDAAYTEEKKTLSGQASATKAMLISAMSAALGAAVGQAAALIAPAVVVLLFLVGKMGQNAFCAGTTEGGGTG
jgi:hypothetical protein